MTLRVYYLQRVEEHFNVNPDQLAGGVEVVRDPDEGHVVHREQRDENQRRLGQLPAHA